MQLRLGELGKTVSLDLLNEELGNVVDDLMQITNENIDYSLVTPKRPDYKEFRESIKEDLEDYFRSMWENVLADTVKNDLQR